MSTFVIVAKLPPCDFEHVTARLAEFDGKTAMGPWAYMCQAHFAMFGTGLGTGRGQQLILGSPHVRIGGQQTACSEYLAVPQDAVDAGEADEYLDSALALIFPPESQS
jgi:hypothetical protein